MSLFCESNSEDDSVAIDLGSLQLRVWVAEDEFNPQKKTLFATHIWPGSQTLAKHLIRHRDMIEGKAVFEFGAGAGIPSITAKLLGAHFVCASDYPAPTVLDNLRKNIELNCEDDQNICILGYKWGDDVSELLRALDGGRYDVLLASECLWRHEQHDDLLASMVQLLSPGGRVLVAFSHHIPNMEEQDLHFFTRAVDAFGFIITNKTIYSAPHLWSDKEIDLFVYELQMANVYV